MKIGDAVWREARDDMGRPTWVNLSLARTIRRDPKNHCTWVVFDKEHAVAVADAIDDLLAGAVRPAATRPRHFDEDPLKSRQLARR
jgi:hypothetical protein